jgi:hypothetical protein
MTTTWNPDMIVVMVIRGIKNIQCTKFSNAWRDKSGKAREELPTRRLLKSIISAKFI